MLPLGMDPYENAARGINSVSMELKVETIDEFPLHGIDNLDLAQSPAYKTVSSSD